MFNRFCTFLFARFGWQLEGELPRSAQFIMIVGPHTSNWDFVLGIVARGAMGINIHFLGKHQLFLPPWGWIFRALGGSPVDRRKHNNLVDAAAQLFKQDANYKLALAPEGTRSPVKRWKTGFYHIAKKAQVVIVPVGFDFSRKRVVFHPAIMPTEDIQQDMQKIIDFYRSINGRHPKTIPDFKQD
jgi:1-acyl-sn-glycerol-3-phosphate acyltransferase